MPTDDRNILEVFKSELAFIDSGGYGRSIRTPWLPTSTFEDSLTCLNFGDLKRSRPCSECVLMQFVPTHHRYASVPCHHIPFDESGNTVRMLERWETQEEMEDVVKNWLRATIKRLEEERSSQRPAQKVESICCLRDVPRAIVA